ncbi:MAG: hypothetical protein ACYC4T_06715 [Melioribacteraceae bacterium]
METPVKILSNYQPRNNFPSHISSKRGETLFLLDFTRTLLKQHEISRHPREMKLFRELELNGFGISDLLLYEFSRSTDKNEFKRQTLTVFEIKIKDWRKAIQQAFRYRYYANRSIVVIPLENIRSAKNNLSVFQELKVGLWGYDRQSKRVFKYYTPKLQKPFSLKAKGKALQIINKEVRSQQFF